MTHPLRLAVFDMDGTLIDSQNAILSAMGSAFAGLERPAPSRAQVLSIVGLSLPQAFARLAPWADETQIAALTEHYRTAVFALRAQKGGDGEAPLYPGARTALERLACHDRVLLGVATGKARRGLDHAFDSHGIGHFFQTCQTADLHPSKPHPAMLEQALTDTGVLAADAVMIGDTTFDIEMGRAAGMATIGVAWGYHPVEALHDAGADRVIDSFDGLDVALNALWGALA